MGWEWYSVHPWDYSELSFISLFAVLMDDSYGLAMAIVSLGEKFIVEAE
jgi:hypothetical protein